tara:strand:- start:733 stop:1341 length:609 start_codon:yes stop_codon:yes gene_type:complete
MTFTTLTGINGTAYSLTTNSGSPVLEMGNRTTNFIAKAALSGISCQFENRTGSTIFIPANTSAEKQSVYAHLGSVSGMTMYTGHFHYPQNLSGTPKLYLVKSNMTQPFGNSCWSGPNFTGSVAPPDCPSGFTSEADSSGSVVITSALFGASMTTNYYGTSNQLGWTWLIHSMSTSGVFCGNAGFPYGSVRVRLCFRTSGQFD